MSDAEPWLGEPWGERRSDETGARPGDWRRWFDRDRARIIHCSAFRRLQTKTQVLGMGGSDFHRTRLTHSMETAQIATGIVGHLAAHAAAPGLLPPATLIEAVALAHDLGHPPFGHGGEVALNWCMREHGGFEGNGQTLRLVTELEAHSHGFGLDLARRTLLGLLKYPVAHQFVAATPAAGAMRAADWKPPKCIYDVDGPILDWVLEAFSRADSERFTRFERPGAAHGRSLHKAFDTCILELADDIAYGVHDLEDAVALKLIRPDDVWAVWLEHRAVVGELDGAPTDDDIEDIFGEDSDCKQAIGLLVNFFIVHVSVRAQGLFASALLDCQAVLPAPVMAFLDALKELIRREVIQQPDVQMREYRGQEIVRRLFETFAADPERFLPAAPLRHWRAARGEAERQRAVCDHVAAMSDEQAIRIHEMFFAPRGGVSYGMR